MPDVGRVPELEPCKEAQAGDAAFEEALDRGLPCRRWPPTITVCGIENTLNRPACSIPLALRYAASCAVDVVPLRVPPGQFGATGANVASDRHPPALHGSSA